MNIIEIFISITIENYNNFFDNVDLISLIDEIITNRKLLKNKLNNEYYSIQFTKFLNENYDYKCVIKYIDSVNLPNTKINDYLKFKFELVQNYIKSIYLKFGQNWTINFISSLDTDMPISNTFYQKQI